MCGLPPFVDEMIDVFIDDDTVYVGVPRLFTRPLRLTAPEGFALVAAGRAAMQLPGADPTGPLGRGLEKLAAALGDDDVVVDLPDPAGRRGAHRRSSPTAVRAVEVLRVEYWTPSRDEVTERTITPRRVFNDRGEWYVVADDGRSGERRTFRIDRIESIERDRRARRAGRARGGRAAPEWFADGGLPQVTLRLAPAATWVVERYPVDEVVPGGGWRRGRVPRRQPALARAAAAASRAPRPRSSTRRSGARSAPRWHGGCCGAMRRAARRAVQS